MAGGSISRDGSWKLLHHRLRHAFAPVHLSFVYPVSRADIEQGASASSCAAGRLCVHASNHRHAPASLSGCALEVRSLADGELLHSAPFAVPALGSVAGADVLEVRQSATLAAAGCAEGECFVGARCEGAPSGSGASIEAEPYFPTPLARCKLSAAALDVEVSSCTAARVQLTVAANTTAPFTFLSTTWPGTFDENGFTLRPGAPRALTFEADPARPIPSRAAWLASLRVYAINNKAPTRFS
jgi:hypothetical protein